jgi:hypothetical protein
MDIEIEEDNLSNKTENDDIENKDEIDDKETLSNKDDLDDIENSDIDDDNVIILSDADSSDNEEVVIKNKEVDQINKIEFDNKKHLQHLTLNEMSKIIMNIDEMINNNVIQIPINNNKSDFIYDMIINNTLDIIIHRPITPDSVILVNLSSLKINKLKLKQKLIYLFN